MKSLEVTVFAIVIGTGVCRAQVMPRDRPLLDSLGRLGCDTTLVIRKVMPEDFDRHDACVLASTARRHVASGGAALAGIPASGATLMKNVYVSEVHTAGGGVVADTYYWGVTFTVPGSPAWIEVRINRLTDAVTSGRTEPWVEPAPIRVLHGVAFDSLNATPLKDAFVSMIGSSRSTTTDSRGLFHFDSVPPGTYSFALQHDVLDSIGLSGTATRVVLTSDRDTVKLAVPSFATLWRAACGTQPPSADSGLVFGTTRAARGLRPIANASVFVTWIDVSYAKTAGFRQRRMTMDSHSDSTGSYALCGVPLGTGLHVQSTADSLASQLVDLSSTSLLRVRRQDFQLALPAEIDTMSRGMVVGLVRNAAKRPVADAIVSTDGVADTRTDANGRFMLRGVPAGTRQVEVRLVGFAPELTTVDVIPRDSVVLNIRFNEFVLLDSVRVTATSPQRWLVQQINDRRRTSAGGTFRDSTNFKSVGTMSAALQAIPGVTIKVIKRDQLMYLPGPGMSLPCKANLWIDGIRTDQDQIQWLRPADIAVVEVYQRMMSAPQQYMVRSSNCGSILIWTKEYVRPSP